MIDDRTHQKIINDAIAGDPDARRLLYLACALARMERGGRHEVDDFARGHWSFLEPAKPEHLELAQVILRNLERNPPEETCGCGHYRIAHGAGGCGGCGCSRPPW